MSSREVIHIIIRVLIRLPSHRISNDNGVDELKEVFQSGEDTEAFENLDSRLFFFPFIRVRKVDD